MNQNVGLTGRARQFSRRLSYGITKALRDWQIDSRSNSNRAKSICTVGPTQKVFDINELVQITKFDKSEIQFIYRDFKLKCPDGILSEKCLVEIYSQLFSSGDCSEYAKHLFSALTQQNYWSNFSSVSNGKEVNFRDFLIALSTLMRGSLDEKIRWIFSFYDLKKDGKISVDEVESLVLSIYSLMGENVNPPIDELAKREHVDLAIQKLFLDSKNEITYPEFYQLFYQKKDLIEASLNTF